MRLGGVKAIKTRRGCFSQNGSQKFRFINAMTFAFISLEKTLLNSKIIILQIFHLIFGVKYLTKYNSYLCSFNLQWNWKGKTKYGHFAPNKYIWNIWMWMKWGKRLKFPPEFDLDMEKMRQNSEFLYTTTAIDHREEFQKNDKKFSWHLPFGGPPPYLHPFYPFFLCNWILNAWNGCYTFLPNSNIFSHIHSHLT